MKTKESFVFYKSFYEAINKLPDLWRKIVLLRYYREMSQQSTAETLGLSQVKISREEKKIIEFNFRKLYI